MKKKKKAALLFSGGQDSTTALGWCLKKFDDIHLLSFDYGQRHNIELKSAKRIVKEIEKILIYIIIKLVKV